MRSILERIYFRDNDAVNIRVLSIEEYPWRYHQCLTIVLVLEGEVGLKLSYSHYDLVKGDVHVIHDGDVYGFEKHSPANKVLLLHVNTEEFSKEFPWVETEVFTTKLTANPSKYDELKLFREKVLDVADVYGSNEADLKLKAADMLQMLHNHFQSFLLNQETREFYYKKSHDAMQSERISKIVSFIYENYDGKLSLGEIAEDFNLDKYYLSHLFQKYVGENFRSFVSMVRVELSEAQLLETEKSVTKISEDVGFSDAKYYIDNFRIWFNCLPNEYRETFRMNTIIYGQTKATEYPKESFRKVIAEYKGLIEGSDTGDEILIIREEELAVLGDILEIEVIPGTGDAAYKLKLKTDNIKGISIKAKNI